MKLAFHGAARTVTGSKHLLTLNTGNKYLLDCGLFQGMGKQTDAMNREWGFDVKEINCLILSHAHIDHSGLIPKLYKDGFRNAIYCTPATQALTCILLQDSAEIHEDDVKYLNKRRRAEDLPPLPPMYSIEDALGVMPQFSIVDYGEWFRIDENVELLYTDAG
ncbi:MAG: MBL fold metallo-hydrolase, partial [Chitinophagaceae bacterium]